MHCTVLQTTCGQLKMEWLQINTQWDYSKAGAHYTCTYTMHDEYYVGA